MLGNIFFLNKFYSGLYCFDIVIFNFVDNYILIFYFNDVKVDILLIIFLDILVFFDCS